MYALLAATMAALALLVAHLWVRLSSLEARHNRSLLGVYAELDRARAALRDVREDVDVQGSYLETACADLAQMREAHGCDEYSSQHCEACWGPKQFESSAGLPAEYDPALDPEAEGLPSPEDLAAWEAEAAAHQRELWEVWNEVEASFCSGDRDVCRCTPCMLRREEHLS